MKHTSELSNHYRWYHIDAKDQVLGRMATEIAGLLIGKQEPSYAANQVPPVYVVITNTDLVRFTGNKLKQKMYRRYSGYSGGLHERTLEEQMKKDSRRVVEEAVFGMLPKNSLRAHRMKRLKLYAGSEHPHLAQLSPKQA
jgi:large subunit ribosomal protein L13